MATEPSTTNGLLATTAPTTHQLSIPFPSTHLPLKIHLHLTISPVSILLFLTTGYGSSSSSSAAPGHSSLVDTAELELAAADGSSGSGGRGLGGMLVDPFSSFGGQNSNTSIGTSPLGSFVVAMPNLHASPSSNAHPLTTPLYSHPPTIETTTRIASILAAKTKRQVYVGNSLDFGAAGAGGNVAEVMEGIRRVVEVVKGVVERVDSGNTEA